MSGVVSSVAGAFAPSITTGFFFATAIAWVDVIRALIAQLVNVPRNAGTYYLLSAVFTTLLSMIVVMVLNRLQGVSKMYGDRR
jgi:uncharacterized membrane protein required for colicin V production